MPVNDRSKMTTETVRVLACREKILFWPFKRHGCLHSHDVWHARDRFRSFCKAWVPPRPRRMARKSSAVRVWVCTHPRCTEGFIQLCCLFTLTIWLLGILLKGVLLEKKCLLEAVLSDFDFQLKCLFIQTKFGEHGYQSFFDKVIEFQSITSKTA